MTLYLWVVNTKPTTLVNINPTTLVNIDRPLTNGNFK